MSENRTEMVRLLFTLAVNNREFLDIMRKRNELRSHDFDVTLNMLERSTEALEKVAAFVRAG